MIPRGAFLTAVLVLGGFAAATAAIPGGDQVISGCFVKATGALRVIDADASQKCKASEAPLSWNQVGLKGEPGDVGPAGPAGEQGPAGVSGAEVYFGAMDGKMTNLKMSVPPGSYVAEVRYQARRDFNGLQTQYLNCDLYAESGGFVRSGATAKIPSTDPWELFEDTAAFVHDGGNIVFECRSGNGDVDVYNPTLTVTKVASVNGRSTSG